MAPWLGAAFVLAALNLAVVLTGRELEALEQALLLVGLCATIVAATLVAARTNGELRQSSREERARPATDELTDSVVQLGSARYAEGMRWWTEAVLELLGHAVESSEPDAPERAELSAAAADTEELRDLLAASTADELTINDTAMIHSVCTLWEANQPRIEELAASVDPIFYRLWRARSVADRRLRHGGAASRPLVLPYRT